MTDTSVIESTATLLSLLRDGDSEARERLLSRYLPVLRRWAHGRLPHIARDLNDTNDLVQITLMSVLKHLDQFDYRHEGAFLAYLRSALMNAVRAEMRRVGRFGVVEAIAADHAQAPAEKNGYQLDSEQWLDYERALSKLSDEKREAVLLRMEFGMTYAEIAVSMQSPSEDAARMFVSRALLEMAQQLA